MTSFFPFPRCNDGIAKRQELQALTTSLAAELELRLFSFKGTPSFFKPFRHLLKISSSQFTLTRSPSQPLCSPQEQLPEQQLAPYALPSVPMPDKPVMPPQINKLPQQEDLQVSSEGSQVALSSSPYAPHFPSIISHIYTHPGRLLILSLLRRKIHRQRRLSNKIPVQVPNH